MLSVVPGRVLQLERAVGSGTVAPSAEHDCHQSSSCAQELYVYDAAAGYAGPRQLLLTHILTVTVAELREEQRVADDV
jgi:hypothetical protein